MINALLILANFTGLWAGIFLGIALMSGAMLIALNLLKPGHPIVLKMERGLLGYCRRALDLLLVALPITLGAIGYVKAENLIQSIAAVGLVLLPALWAAGQMDPAPKKG